MPRAVRPKRTVVTLPPATRTQWARRWMMMLACGLLGVNIILGDRVGLDSRELRLQAGSDYRRLESEIAQLRRENRRLGEEARRLREDPAAIEAVARGELGLIRPGEVVFLLADESSTRRRRSR